MGVYRCMYPNHDLCRNRRDCFLAFGNKYSSKIRRNLDYYMGVLQGLYADVRLYHATLDEIRRGIYATSYAQHTMIPKLNVLGNPITEPSDVYYNLKLSRLEKEIKITKNTIKELRIEENKILKTLKRSERRKKEYGYESE